MLDGDSIMPAETMVTLARTMEGNDTIGLIQSINYEIHSGTLLGKLRSYGHNLGNLLAPSARYYFRIARGVFRGHNAILRTEAMMQHCNLPVLSKYGPFPAGKPKSHDFIEAFLLEGAGYEVWELPTLVAFDDQIHNLLDAMKREARWIYGALDWLRFFRLKKLSSFGKMSLFVYSVNYFNAVTGLIFFVMSYLGLYYMVHYPLMIHMIMFRYHNIFMWSFYIFVFSMVTAVALPLIALWKKYRTSVSMVKSLYSFLLGGLINITMSPIGMILINCILWSWLKGKVLVWGSQNRTERVLSWDECVKSLWIVSVCGLVCAYFLSIYIFPYFTPRVQKLLGFSLSSFVYFICAPVVAMVFAPVTVRFTSRSFPLMEKMGWFKHQFEGENEPLVVRETRNMTGWFEKQIPEEWGFEQALSDPYFALRHLAQCPSRPQKYAFWKNKLAGRNIQDLTRLEKLVVFRCRELWEMFMTKNFDVSKEKLQ